MLGGFAGGSKSKYVFHEEDCVVISFFAISILQTCLMGLETTIVD